MKRRMAGIFVLGMFSSLVFVQPASAQTLAPAPALQAPSASILAPDFLAALRSTPMDGTSAVAAQDPKKPFDAYEAAKKKRTLGRELMLGGAAAIAVGFVMVKHEVDSGVDECGAYACGFDARKGGFVYLGGAGVFTWGFIIFRHAGKELHQLESQRNGKGGSTIALPLSEHESVDITVGPRSTLAYRVAW